MRGTGKTTLCSILQKVGGTLGNQCHYFVRMHVLDLLPRINICAEALRGLVVKLWVVGLIDEGHWWWAHSFRWDHQPAKRQEGFPTQLGKVRETEAWSQTRGDHWHSYFSHRHLELVQHVWKVWKGNCNAAGRFRGCLKKALTNSLAATKGEKQSKGLWCPFSEMFFQKTSFFWGTFRSLQACPAQVRKRWPLGRRRGRKDECHNTSCLLQCKNRINLSGHRVATVTKYVCKMPPIGLLTFLFLFPSWWLLYLLICRIIFLHICML